jgi:hypothetical protein
MKLNGLKAHVGAELSVADRPDAKVMSSFTLTGSPASHCPRPSKTLGQVVVTREPLHRVRQYSLRYGICERGPFRHTYRSWLDLVGTTIGVQQKLMRHAQIATTMNVYGNAMMESKREANSKVVQMALRQEVRKAR